MFDHNDGLPSFALVADGDTDGLRQHLTQHPDAVHDTVSWGDSLLHRAARQGALDMVEVLLQAGALVDSRDLHGQTPLFLTHNASIVSALLEAGADPNAEAESGARPLHGIARHTPQHVSMLLAAGAAPDPTDATGSTPLLEVCGSGGGTAMETESAAKLERRLHAAQALVEAGADVGARGTFGNVVLHGPARLEAAHALVRWLLEAGADPTVPNSDRKTPLDVAHPAHRLLLERYTTGWDHSRYTFWWDEQARAAESITTIDKLVAHMTSEGVATREQLRGCTEQEIRALEEAYDIVLPASYRAFLTTMGHDSGGLFGWDNFDVQYPWVLEATREQRGFAEEDGELESFAALLGPRPLLICGRHGEQFFYLHGDSPTDQVHFWNADNEETQLAYESVLSFLVAAMLKLL